MKTWLELTPEQKRQAGFMFRASKKDPEDFLYSLTYTGDLLSRCFKTNRDRQVKKHQDLAAPKTEPPPSLIP